MIRLVWYFVCFLGAFYGLSALDLRKITKTEGPQQVTLLFLLTACLAYWMVQVLYFLAWGV